LATEPAREPSRRRVGREDAAPRRRILEEAGDLAERQILEEAAQHQAAAGIGDDEIEIAEHLMTGQKRAPAAIQIGKRQDLDEGPGTAPIERQYPERHLSPPTPWNMLLIHLAKAEGVHS